MVDKINARQFEGFDFNDYYFFDTSAWTWDVGAGQVAAIDEIQLYIAGTEANALLRPLALLIPTIAAAMGIIPQPGIGQPATSIGPQYPWPFHGTGPGPAALPTIALNNIALRPLSNPLNNAPVQKTLLRVVTNDMYVYMLNQRMAQVLYAALLLNPLWPDGLYLADGGPGTFAIPRWPLPVPILLEADVGLYEFERKWIWLLAVRAVGDADADLHVYMEG